MKITCKWCKKTAEIIDRPQRKHENIVCVFCGGDKYTPNPNTTNEVSKIDK